MPQSIPGIVAAITGSLVAFSVLYDVAYFLVVDYTFFRFMTINDHISSALDRLPMVALIMAGYVVANFFQRNWSSVTDYNPQYHLKLFEYRGFAIKTVPDHWFSLILVTVGGALTVWLVGWEHSIVQLGFFMYIAWEILMLRVSRTFNRLGWEGIFVWVFFVPLLIIYALYFGISYGYADRRMTGEHYIVLKNDNPLTNVKPLRSTQHLVLVHDPARGAMRYLKWEEIEEIGIMPGALK